MTSDYIIDVNYYNFLFCLQIKMSLSFHQLLFISLLGVLLLVIFYCCILNLIHFISLRNRINRILILNEEDSSEDESDEENPIR